MDWFFNPRTSFEALLAPVYLWLLVRVIKHAWMWEPKAKKKSEQQHEIS